MSDDTTKKLNSTTDAQVWAEEWCRIAREIEAAGDGRHLIDEGWMVGWFANAMCVAADAERKKVAEEIMGYPITIDVARLGTKSKSGAYYPRTVEPIEVQFPHGVEDSGGD